MDGHARAKAELLAPAGSREALEAAINSGADAVYLGGKQFGARAFADNFSDEELADAVQFAHLHAVKLYVTVNTLISDSEMRDAVKWLIFLNNIGVDAIIVQDMGILRAASMLVPDLPIHASTQMTITSSPGVRFARDCGITRAVPARELTLQGIKSACCQGIEIESFIHGALCICYSGQCLMSSLIGGRSGNRGQCAQPCRMPYALEDEQGKRISQGAGAYLLSPKDMNTLSLIPQLIDVGVASFKIEGRMKRPEYVAVVTGAYRRAIDSLKTGRYEAAQDDAEAVEQIFSRGFTTAYLQKRQGRAMMSDDRPNNHGVPVGRVLSSGKKTAVIKLQRRLNAGDALEAPKGSSFVTFKASGMRVNGQCVKCAAPGASVELDVPYPLKPGTAVLRVLDVRLMEDAKRLWGGKNKKRIPLHAHAYARLGAPLEITLTDEDGSTAKAVTSTAAQEAVNRPLDAEGLKKQIDRLGNTEYRLASFSADIAPGIIVPASEINEARRTACARLDRLRLERAFPQRIQVSVEEASRFLSEQEDAFHKAAAAKRQRIMLSVWSDTTDNVKSALSSGADRIIWGGDFLSGAKRSCGEMSAVVELVHSSSAEIAVSTPRIVSELQIPYVKRLLQDAEKAGADMLNVHNLSAWQLAVEAETSLPLWADMSLNIFNSQAVEFWREKGAVGVTPSVELNLNQIKAMRCLSPLPFECLVHGPIEMMVSEYCAAGSFIGNVGRGKCSFCCREKTWLKDRRGARFQAAGDRFCRMHILNSQDLCMLSNVPKLRDAGIDAIRIDARTYAPSDCARITSLYRKAIEGRAQTDLPNMTRGHYFRGV